jgi:hypothetical protein
MYRMQPETSLEARERRHGHAQPPDRIDQPPAGHATLAEMLAGRPARRVRSDLSPPPTWAV